MKRYFMIMLRFILEVILYIVLSPFIVIILLVTLIEGLINYKKLNEAYGISRKDIFKIWLSKIKLGMQMNKDYVINGFMV